MNIFHLSTCQSLTCKIVLILCTTETYLVTMTFATVRAIFRESRIPFMSFQSFLASVFEIDQSLTEFWKPVYCRRLREHLRAKLFQISSVEYGQWLASAIKPTNHIPLEFKLPATGVYYSQLWKAVLEKLSHSFSVKYCQWKENPSTMRNKDATWFICDVQIRNRTHTYLRICQSSACRWRCWLHHSIKFLLFCFREVIRSRRTRNNPDLRNLELLRESGP
jgi:hypothetical protein